MQTATELGWMSTLASSNGLKPEILELFCMNFEILMSGDIGDGRELLIGLIFDGLTLDVDMLIELCRLLVVDAFDLFEEGFLLFLILEGVVVVSQVLLVVLL